MPPATYAVVTFGCRVNQADSLEIEERCLDRGLSPATPLDADLVVVNTCSVTSAADQAARQTIRRIGRLNPSARLVITGCYATRRPDELASLPGVTAVIPNSRKELLVEESGLTTAARYGDGDGECGVSFAPGLAGRTAFTLRVQTGCDQACSYCIIPSTRGRGRSRPVAEVLREVERAATAGYLEIALTGVHLGSYGRDLAAPTSLVRLLRAIDAASFGLRIRISSLEPMDCSDELVDLVAGSSTLAPHFHLPLQHATGRMLAAMQRPYDPPYYRRLVGRIRAVMPHASIGSDVIVGFPGETAEDFSALTRYLEDSTLSHVHVFPYSDRPGTDAARMFPKVAGAMVRERASHVRTVGAELTRRFYCSQHGETRPGLTTEDGTLVVTDNYLKVRIAPGLERNRRVAVQVQYDGDQLTGVVLT